MRGLWPEAYTDIRGVYSVCAHLILSCSIFFFLFNLMIVLLEVLIFHRIRTQHLVFFSFIYLNVGNFFGLLGLGIRVVECMHMLINDFQFDST